MKPEDREKYSKYFLPKNQANLLKYKHVREGMTYWFNHDFFFYDQKFAEEFSELFDFALECFDQMPDSKEDEEAYNKAFDQFEFTFGRKIVNGAKKAGVPTREYHIQWQNFEHLRYYPYVFQEKSNTGEDSYISPQSGERYNDVLRRYFGNFRNRNKTMHAVLLGDSIFDNHFYVQPGQPDVIAQLQTLLPKATLRAADASIIELIYLQIQDLPEDATHLVVSIGGNDCLQAMSIFGQGVDNVGGAMLKLRPIVEKFEKDYDKMLKSLLKFRLPITLCTIYEPQYPDPTQQQILLTALKLFNDLIISAAIRESIPVIDLRVVCSKPEDFANPIEPSMIGGAKIADCIARVLHQHDFTKWRCSIYS